ncbi:MAG: Hpt domain-containing protein [Rhizomicrobium sp.]|jgi:HPt (histidine-containing phosphotransfer) domain-containing protein
MNARPVDLAHLSRYTGGDLALNAEVLQLFVNQAGELVQRMDGVLQSGDAKTWREVAHSLKGAARGIGAFAMADAAAACEPIDPASDSTSAAGALRLLKSDSEAVKIFIDAYLNR